MWTKERSYAWMNFGSKRKEVKKMLEPRIPLSIPPKHLPRKKKEKPSNQIDLVTVLMFIILIIIFVWWMIR